MGIKARVAKVLGFERNGVDETTKVDPGGGANQTCDHYAPSGVDAPPLPGDFAALDDSAGTGNESCTGYADPLNTRVARPGEHRVYARDENGLVVGSTWHKRDGTIVANNANAQVEISPAGIMSALCPEVRLGTAAGAQIARVGDLVSVVTPPMTVLVAGVPVLVIPIPPTAVSPTTGGILCTGQIISGAQTVKAGP